MHMAASESNACRHVAIIMDGNGRWAKKRFLPRTMGHNAGVKSVKRVVKAAIEHHVEALTLYAFSTENWSRPDEEVSFLVKLFIKTLDRELQSLNEAGVAIHFIGDTHKFPLLLQQKLHQAVELTRNNQQLDLIIALNYGSRAEIVSACKAIAQDVQNKFISLDEVDEVMVSQRLALHDFPPVDLLIRTSGEQRLSNFLLWQLAYAEFYFTECLWPDFNENEFNKALMSFAERERRFGAVTK
ncbi:di-trans,poly-cis-decaprenylcistransferase [Wohlfahrtiimonas chitiniclastica]|uniref:Ditrans,polycis-undecaprenyl-diphosphate synthase ((2E,6E)-farnesyl-diphosphate specific) n=2 Tax=Wohlfahrtiimonas chitiniclastica TaxID=400946 RepID=L8Y2D5_9GAMM|nr:Ditrans,polycis-undecaprenyl-diphosphate synthase ((2E,6E)-farnesyl-diphosphate specific) [Wohlfahrtiimonas chitiniclastica SH04]KZX37818.1 di-trans,poly-cis-decaprenylcistransferase [Wohlfahrtiimonas chitiniclastica]MDC7251593.1 ditrans,polycis-undecaprenyl-diphosphate synthase [Wohlfahrtiimonas chitiniclastica]OYQ71300.1 di-trans,poly-cis-decaprenylcistransferase [Wohlfahrtiimonas chitiniclastica]OYQ76528.1 di-trans,poly-cis-decaprenylcistransferase [Wohlfahrtiimonas chitiniclastica]